MSHGINGHVEPVRRIHMNCFQSLAYSNSQPGATPLTHPSAISRSSLNPNRGLYPREKRIVKNQGLYPRQQCVTRDQGLYPRQQCVTRDQGLYPRQQCVTRDQGLYPRQQCVTRDQGLYPRQQCVNRDQGLYPRQQCITNDQGSSLYVNNNNNRVLWSDVSTTFVHRDEDPNSVIPKITSFSSDCYINRQVYNGGVGGLGDCYINRQVYYGGVGGLGHLPGDGSFLWSDPIMAGSEGDPPKQSGIPSGFGFISARAVLDPMAELLNREDSLTRSPESASSHGNSRSPRKEPQNVWGVKRKRSAGCNQANKMSSYFTPAPKLSTASCTVTSQTTGNSDKPNGRSNSPDLIDLTQAENLVIPAPSQAKNNAFSHLKQHNKTQEHKKRPASKQAGHKKKKPEPKFNRSNPFLYSGPPIISPRKEHKYSDKYGLLGSGTVAIDDEIDYFSLLPLEVIENIFCRLPLMDLCLNLTRVCSDWNSIISEEKFLRWKKMYFRILRGDEVQRRHLVQIMNDNNIISLQSVLPGLIRYMRDFKPVTSLNMMECLMKHSRYSWAKALIQERLPDCVINQEAQPWCVITALVLVSETVDDVYDIISCLLGTPSQCTATEVLECMYCVATFLLQLKTLRYRDVWTGMHYRLYYALYLFENKSSATCEQLREAFNHSSGQQTILKYGCGDTSVRYTHEQLRICNHNVAEGEILKIVAFAGTGKTTTLIRYTQLRPQLKFLLIVYNKSVQEHCSVRFPKVNVTCKTSHGLARGSKEGRRYGHKIGNMRVSDIAESIPSRKGENLYVQAKFVIDTINTFMASADRTIGLSHVPMEFVNDKGAKEFLGTKRRERLVEDATVIWERATNPRDLDMRLPHDGYLKMYQLSQPQLQGYDAILIDEAQDLTPAVIDIILQQTQPKILVGDPNQQIYSFRGAVNAMDLVTATTTYYLTQSFRFGSQIAFVANCCLELLKGEHKKVLVGNSQKGCITGDQVGQLAIITRSNFTLFSEAVKKCCLSNEKIRVAFAGGTAAFGFDMLQDIYMLLLSPEDRAKEKHVIRHPLVSKFNTLADLEKFATKTSDNELLGKIKIVRTYTHQLPSLVNKILEKAVKDIALADVVLSTTHKAKGLEFPTVRVTDDFAANFLPAEAQGTMASPAVAADEYNLLYVAVTRAKKALQLSPTLMRILDYSGEKFRYPRFSADLGQQGSPLCCMMTDAEFEPCALTLERKSITLGGGTSLEAGYFCPQVVLEDFPALSGLYGSVKDQREEGESKTARTRQEARWEGRHAMVVFMMEDEDDLEEMF